MTSKILVLVKKDGLNYNLLRLALDSGKFDLSFLEPREVDEHHFRRSDCLVVDDSAFGSLEELEQGLGPEARGKRVIYLSKNDSSESEFEANSCWSCLLKPFNPRELAEKLSS